jgi:hypothetical protein
MTEETNDLDEEKWALQEPSAQLRGSLRGIGKAEGLGVEIQIEMEI